MTFHNVETFNNICYIFLCRQKSSFSLGYFCYKKNNQVCLYSEIYKYIFIPDIQIIYNLTQKYQNNNNWITSSLSWALPSSKVTKCIHHVTMIKPLRLLKPALKVSCDPVCPWSPCTGFIFFALITWNMTCVPGLLPLLSTQEKTSCVFKSTTVGITSTS